VSDQPLVLCVDDDEDILALVEIRLGSAGYEVVTANDGLEALEAARERRPSVVILDMMMPRLNGLDTLAQIRADPQLADVPVILLSARVQEEDVRRGLAAGADAYVIKPFKFGELEDAIERLLYGAGGF
jgi:DNA-binding response OmpR family regulator